MLPSFESFIKKDNHENIIDILVNLKKLTDRGRIFWYLNENLTQAIAYFNGLEIIIENHEIKIHFQEDQSQLKNFIVLKNIILELYEKEVIALYESIKNKTQQDVKNNSMKIICDILKNE